MSIAVDFSAARPTVAQLRAAGVVLVIRYLTGLGAKPITPAELAEYLDAGVVVVFVFEIGATDAQGGVAAGRTNAQAAVAALTTLGIAGCPVYFAVDEDIAPASAVNYFEGINSVLQPAFVGCYGEGALCTLLQTEGLATWFWQSESTSFPGNATTLAITHLQQKFNASPIPDTDLDLILKPDVGQWPRPVPIGECEVDVPILSEATGTTQPYWTKSVQSLLETKFNQTLKPDGDYGPATAACVAVVQKFFGMTVDGVVGPETWAVLLGF